MSAPTWIYGDGGRAAAGFLGKTGDCVKRAIAIATGKPYREVYDAINAAATTSALASASAANPRRALASTSRPSGATSKRLAGRWTPTMPIGSGCKVHLRAEELPKGRLVVALSKHSVAVIDGVVHDIYDSAREGTRCVYGYFQRRAT